MSGSKLPLRKGFTLIELLVVVAIIALLISILLPALNKAREEGKKAKCLAHLKGIGQAAYSYASEDPTEQVVPISRNMVSKGVPYWLSRTADWFCYGGNNANRPFPTGGVKYLLGGDPNYYANSGGTGTFVPGYDANRRPLNLYMGWSTSAADNRSLEQFQCPGDKGYPDDPKVDDAPLKAAEIPCYDMLGNSFRASMASYSGAGAGAPSNGFFAFGPWGHRLGTLTENSRTILFGEPTFFNMIHSDTSNEDGLPSIPYVGWHRSILKDNLVFVDGSARYTSVPKPEDSKKYQVTPEDQMKMGVFRRSLLTRGPSYKLDVYPTPGARIYGDWQSYTASPLWPFKGFQDNLRVTTPDNWAVGNL